MSSVFTRFNKAWTIFTEIYKESRNQYDYNGYNSKTKCSDSGPHFWSEQDIVFHLSQELQNQFSKYWIHNELSVSSHTFANFNTKKEKREWVDIVISNPFLYEKNWRHIHDAFVEVKWINRGKIFGDYNKLRDRSEKDCDKLTNQLLKGRCKEAYFCLIDDNPSESKISDYVLAKWRDKYKPVKIFLLRCSKENTRKSRAPLVKLN